VIVAKVGSLRWAEKTQGRLRARDYALLLGQLAVALGESLAHTLLGPLQSRLSGADLDVPVGRYIDGQTPVSQRAMEAGSLLESISERWLAAHSHRTYAFAILLGRGLSFDKELLFVAAMLHDVALTPQFGRGTDPGLVAGYAKASAPCFAVRSAEVAKWFAARSGWPDDLRLRSAEAISMHLNVRVTKARIEAHLLQAGSALDVIGHRFDQLPQEWIREVEHRWPRGAVFPSQIAGVWSEATSPARCRGRFLNRWASFERRLWESRPPDWYEATPGR
jgi:hypothetical protein